LAGRRKSAFKIVNLPADPRPRLVGIFSAFFFFFSFLFLFLSLWLEGGAPYKN